MPKQECLRTRVSQAWENEVLTANQLSYAATDAYAALLLYEMLSPIQVPQPLSRDAPRGTPVLIYSTDNTVPIAQGQISQADCTVMRTGSKTFDDIRISSAHTVVDVHEVFVPGAIVSSHQRKALNTFGDTVRGTPADPTKTSSAARPLASPAHSPARSSTFDPAMPTTPRYVPPHRRTHLLSERPTQ